MKFKLKRLLARIDLIDAKLTPIKFSAQNMITQINFTEEELDRINGILKTCLKEIQVLKVKRWNTPVRKRR